MKSSEKLVVDLSILGKAVKYLSGESDEFPKEFTETELSKAQELVEQVHVFNSWFTPEMVKKSLSGIGYLLNESELIKWQNSYSFQEDPEKKVAIIMASNVPLVGFHDLLSVLVSGNKALVKMSKDDDRLLPALMDLFFHLDPSYKNRIEFAQGELKEFDAVIATGSDNTSRYFKEYFSSYPNIIRKNRTSVAVLDSSISDEEIKLFADDIFDYFGLGCRNVGKCFIPKGFDLDRLFQAIYHKSDVINHNKYANNYDYNRAIHLMNQEEMLDNGFILLKKSEDLFSPLGMLFYQEYEDLKEVEDYIDQHKEKIQIVIGKKGIPFGQGQKPGLFDYADDVDVMKFLEQLS